MRYRKKPIFGDIPPLVQAQAHGNAGRVMSYALASVRFSVIENHA